ncbi:MAG: MATE family efflux transporter [Myxococcota bacterium]
MTIHHHAAGLGEPEPSPPPAPEPRLTAVGRGPLRAEVGATLRLAGPVIVAQLGMMTMGLVDVMMVGALGSEALAGVSLGNAVFFAALIFFGGIIMSLDTMVSQSVGAGLPSRSGAMLWQAIWLGLGMGVFLNLAFLDVKPLLLLLGQEEGVAAIASDYVFARSFSAIPFLLFGACRGLLNGVGNTRPVMVITLVANVVNLCADALLIHGLCGAPALGATGAGVATTVVRWFMLLCIILVLRRKAYRPLRLAPVGPRAAPIRTMIVLGLPIGGQLLAEVGVFSATGILVGLLGATSLAEHQIALSCVSFAFMVPLGLGVAANVRVGHAVGRRDPEGAMRAGKVAMGLGMAVMLLPSIVFIAFPELLTRAFSAEPHVVAGTVALMRIAVAFQLADGLQAVAAGSLRGAAETRAPFVANLVSHWLIGLPLGAWLAFSVGLGVPGLWWGLTLALLLVAASLAHCFLKGGWRARGAVV